MTCKECQSKPLIRGIQRIKCMSCGAQTTIMSGDFYICSDCSDARRICMRCGKPIGADVVKWNIKELRQMIQVLWVGCDKKKIEEYLWSQYLNPKDVAEYIEKIRLTMEADSIEIMEK